MSQSSGTRERDYSVDHRLSDREENVHATWDASLDPALTIEPGEVVRFECRDAVDGQIDVETTAEDVPDVSFDPVHPITGPVAIEGAEPGNVLEVEFLDLQHKGWGYNLFFPGEMGLGLLPEDFEEPGLHVWDLEDDVGHFVEGIEVPLDPFPGIAGVCPAGADGLDTLSPRSVGGNIDVKHLTAGSTLYLPVEEEGALFSTGDCHIAQGDGEVCVTGVEVVRDGEAVS
jgi:acetamidase/formamidase